MKLTLTTFVVFILLTPFSILRAKNRTFFVTEKIRKEDVVQVVLNVPQTESVTPDGRKIILPEVTKTLTGSELEAFLTLLEPATHKKDCKVSVTWLIAFHMKNNSVHTYRGEGSTIRENKRGSDCAKTWSVDDKMKTFMPDKFSR